MIVRQIRPEELRRTQEICSVAFEYSIDFTKSAQQIFEETLANPESREDVYWQNHFAAFKDDDVTMMSTFSALPFPINFDGHQCKMYGIGGVSTLPQYRRSGGVRGCFELALPWMLDNGAVFSYLYPFSTAYYRKFGYEMGCHRRKYRLLMDRLPRFELDGDCYMLETGAGLRDDIIAIARDWQTRYNMMVVSEDLEYAWIDKANPTKDQLFTYVYKSKDGSPMGYVSLKKVDEDGSRNLVCTRMQFTCAEGFKGLIRLLASLASDHHAVSFTVPEDWNLEPLLPELSFGAVKCELEPYGMVRVIDVEKALSLTKIKGEGMIRIAVTDAHIPQNNGCFKVLYAAGEKTQVSRTDEAPDLQMDIAAFSPLILGVYETETMRYMPTVTSHVPLSALAPLFYKKKNYICEYF